MEYAALNPFLRPRNLKEGVLKSIASLAGGAFGVVVAPLATPVEAVRKHGAVGLASGVPEGLIGAVVCALGGISGAVAHPILAVACPVCHADIPVLRCCVDRDEVLCTKCQKPFFLSPLYKGACKTWQCRACRGISESSAQHWAHFFDVVRLQRLG
eukprot:TRINITY_DN84461_c0_g1_i1.p1 TRINITY_DN84461_c0_g1~~TRINITY_DN84461_c0_g1_i1.p1  ORF type:complete len:156 (+),score=8.14 TRINITY_DN84461_c0_g1_i1:44-511(+)